MNYVYTSIEFSNRDFTSSQYLLIPLHFQNLARNYA